MLVWVCVGVCVCVCVDGIGAVRKSWREEQEWEDFPQALHGTKKDELITFGVVSLLKLETNSLPLTARWTF